MLYLLKHCTWICLRILGLIRILSVPLSNSDEVGIAAGQNGGTSKIQVNPTQVNPTIRPSGPSCMCHVGSDEHFDVLLSHLSVHCIFPTKTIIHIVQLCSFFFQKIERTTDLCLRNQQLCGMHQGRTPMGVSPRGGPGGDPRDMVARWL